jgi:hypothetical protein
MAAMELTPAWQVKEKPPGCDADLNLALGAE